MRVWIDQDLCTDHCPEIFLILEDGISYVHDGAWVGNDPGGPECLATVPPRLERAAVAAAEDCPGECILIEVDQPGTEGDQP